MFRRLSLVSWTTPYSTMNRLKIPCLFCFLSSPRDTLWTSSEILIRYCVRLVCNQFQFGFRGKDWQQARTSKNQYALERGMTLSKLNQLSLVRLVINRTFTYPANSVLCFKTPQENKKVTCKNYQRRIDSSPFSSFSMVLHYVRNGRARGRLPLRCGATSKPKRNAQ